MGYEREVPARQKAIDLSKKKAAIEAEMDTIYDSLTVSRPSKSSLVFPFPSFSIRLV